jgi:hypothetical protein
MSDLIIPSLELVESLREIIPATKPLLAPALASTTFIAFTSAGGYTSQGDVVLSADKSVTVTEGTKPVYAIWRFNTDGTVDRRAAGGTWNYNHDWHDSPAAGIGDYYEVVYANLSGDREGTLGSTYETLTANKTIGVTISIHQSGDPIQEAGNADITLREIEETSNFETYNYAWSATYNSLV